MDLEALKSSAEARPLVERIESLVTSPVSLMEVCGTHTVAISRFGLRSLLPERLRLLSGPGCPVCVTPVVEIDRSIKAARTDGVILTTFGDMMRVPGSASTLEREKAEGADVRILYSALESLDIAAENPGSEVVFVGVGFETTSPTVAATVLEAERRGVTNFSVLPFFKTVPGALDLLASVPGRPLDGFICPGHVSTIIGSDAYMPVARDHNLPCVVVGFEALDILAGIVMLLKQVQGIRDRGERARVETQYSRAVTPGGNRAAAELLARVFEPCDAEWRGIGTIDGSGYRFAAGFRSYDARERIELTVEPSPPATGCICGEIMLGAKLPPDCALFGSRCTPRDPVGPCMVSTEGSCAAFYKYERGEQA